MARPWHLAVASVLLGTALLVLADLVLDGHLALIETRKDSSRSIHGLTRRLRAQHTPFQLGSGAAFQQLPSLDLRVEYLIYAYPVSLILITISMMPRGGGRQKQQQRT